MSQAHARPRLPLLLLSLLAPFIPLQAKAEADLSLQPDGSLLYTGDTARATLGYSKGGRFHGELAGVLHESADSAWLAEGWLAESSGGLKLSYHRALGESVHKYFIAHDANQTHDRKLTLGYGMERADWFGNLNLSRGLTGRRLVDRQDSTATRQESGTADGRAFIDTISQTTSLRIYEKAYDYGVGLRAGRYFSGAGVRITTGYDHEWGRGNARQNTVSLAAEKFFVGTPHSVAIQVDHARKSGEAEIRRNDTRVMLAYRFSFGGPNTQPQRAYRMVETSQPAASPAGAAAAPAAQSAPPDAAAPAPARFEKQWVKTKASMTSGAFFELGSFQLTAAARAELDRVAEQLRTQGHEGNVRIVGHTCDIGSDRVNDRLSMQRAQAVRDYLVALGAIGADEALVEGKGKHEPKYPNTPDTREKNRRVELEYLSFVDKEQLVAVAVSPAPAAAEPAPAPAPAPAVTYEREWVDQPPAWIRQALRTTAQHKRTVDVYRMQEETRTESRSRQFVNRAPSAQDDAYTVVAGSTTAFAVLANDSDPDSGDSLSLVSVTSAGRGTVRMEGQQIVYTAPADFAGQDRFSYTVKDSEGLTGTAHVVVTVTAAAAANRAPVAGADRFVVSGRLPTPLNVLANDSDPDGDALTIVSVTQPVGRTGTLRITGSQIVFTPYAPFYTDTFTYTISDGRGGFATATVELMDP